MQYLTTSRVAHKLVLSEAAVRKLADAGVLPVAATLSDGTRLFDPEAVTTYAKRRRDLECRPHSVPSVPDAELFGGRSAPIIAPGHATGDGRTERDK